MENNTRRIILISTGGTIACKPTERGLSPALSASDMLAVAGVDNTQIECVDLFSMDSSNVQPEEWLTISREIMSIAKSGKADGIVLTHGTDTMAYTASMLEFLVRGISIPVVLTGSQQPIVYPDSDGRRNLPDAITAARGLGRGVYICFGGVVIKGCRAVKTHTISANAFESINYPYVGAVHDGKFTMLTDMNATKELTDNYSSAIDPRVVLIKLIPGTSPAFIESVLSCGIIGVVIESFGLGGVHSFRRDHNEAIKKLMNNGVSVVLTSQCLYEASALDVYEVSRPLFEAGAISAYDMTTEAAVTKLMWALGQTNDPNEVKTIMNRNFCGEITR